jgi:type IV pilus assembly protein PilC
LVLYRYRAKTPHGKTMEGTLEAPDQREAARLLRSRGLLVTSIADNREAALPVRRAPGPGVSRSVALGAGGPPARFRLLRPRAVGLKELALFCRQFAVMVTAGVAILTSLHILTRQAASKRLREALSEVAQGIERGQSMSEAFGARNDVFPSILINMVSAGEAGGILEESFERLADHFDKEYAVNQKVRSAMTYPAVVSLVAVGVGIFMVVFILPTFVNLFMQMGATLPLPTRIIMGVSEVVKTRWYLILGSFLLLAASFQVAVATPRGAYMLDAFALKMPVFGSLVLRRAVCRFARTLGTLLKSGVPLLVCLSVVERTVGSRPIAAAISQAGEEIRAGRGIVEPLRASKLFPTMVLEMMAVGEETGAIDTMLTRVADFYDTEIDVTVQRLSSMIEPLIIVVVGGGVGLLLVSLIMPMFDVYSQLNL